MFFLTTFPCFFLVVSPWHLTIIPLIYSCFPCHLFKDDLSPCLLLLISLWYLIRCGTPTPVSGRRLWAGGAGWSPSSASLSRSMEAAAYSSSSLLRYWGHVTSSGPMETGYFTPRHLHHHHAGRRRLRLHRPHCSGKAVTWHPQGQ